MKTFKYTVCWASGKVESISVPSLFTPHEVSQRICHDLLFLHIPKGHTVFNDGPSGGKITGPALALITAEEKAYRVPLTEILDEKSAYYCYHNRQ